MFVGVCSVRGWRVEMAEEDCRKSWSLTDHWFGGGCVPCGDALVNLEGADRPGRPVLQLALLLLRCAGLRATPNHLSNPSAGTCKICETGNLDPSLSHNRKNTRRTCFCMDIGTQIEQRRDIILDLPAHPRSVPSLLSWVPRGRASTIHHDGDDGRDGNGES